MLLREKNETIGFNFNMRFKIFIHSAYVYLSGIVLCNDKKKKKRIKR